MISLSDIGAVLSLNTSYQYYTMKKSTSVGHGDCFSYANIQCCTKVPIYVFIQAYLKLDCSKPRSFVTQNNTKEANSERTRGRGERSTARPLPPRAISFALAFSALAIPMPHLTTRKYRAVGRKCLPSQFHE